jgi:hypothetical protein
MKRVPFSERLWRPAPYLGSEDREDRERVLAHLDERRECQRIPLQLVAQHGEFRPGYVAEVRRRIIGKGEEMVAQFPQRVGLVVGSGSRG